MASDDELVTLTYNGEIYNFRELRAELEYRGHRFRTSGDTEVIIAAWRQRGPDCLSRLNGMFAFAIHDHARGCLFLARARLGDRKCVVEGKSVSVRVDFGGRRII